MNASLNPSDPSGLPDLSEMYICNVHDKKVTGPSEHCLKYCYHGDVHRKDSCTGEEFCCLHESGDFLKVKCRKLRKKEILRIREGKRV
jgi:hypothetical protein